MGKNIAENLRAIKLRWIVGVLLLALIVKLVWFEPPLTRESALDTAEWQLKRASEELRFDLSKFGKPSSVHGGKDGFIVTWSFRSSSNEVLDVYVMVAPLDVDFGGRPFILDCRHPSGQVRRAGFGYLCKDPIRGSLQLGP